MHLAPVPQPYLRPNLLLLSPFLAISLLVAVDLVSDFHHGGSLVHLAGEAAIVGLTALGGGRLWKERARARRTAAHLADQVDRMRAQAEDLRAQNEQWRQESESAAQGLREAIDCQFERWSLTKAEAEVALLLLKGLSLKEVAAVRETSERTARQQSLSVYRKSSLAGRAELAAYFLEDLLSPSAAAQALSQQMTSRRA